MRISRGAIVFLVCLAAFLVSVVAGSWLMIPISGLAVLSFQLRRRIDRMTSHSVPVRTEVFAVFPRYQFQAREALSIDFDLDSSSYAIAGESTGQLTLSVKLDQGDKERFIKAGGQSQFQEIHAGFYRARGMQPRASNLEPQAKPRFADAIHGPLPSRFVEILPSSSIGATIPYDVVNVERAPRQSQSRLPFHVMPNQNISALESRAWGLTFKLSDRGPTRATIETLIVHVPPELKSVQFTDGVFESENARVVWRDVSIGVGRPGSIQVQFAEPIQSVPALDAEYEVRLGDNLLSDLRMPADSVWYPSGEPVEPERISVEKLVTIKGKIRAATRLQPKRQEIIAKKSTTQLGRLLTIDLAHNMIAALSKRGLYAKNISEVPPGRLIFGDGQIRRSWEIIGRYYLENQPYDVHVIMTGEDCHTRSAETKDAQVGVEIVARNLSELEFAPKEAQRVEAAALDLLSAATQVLGSVPMRRMQA